MTIGRSEILMVRHGIATKIVVLFGLTAFLFMAMADPVNDLISSFKTAQAVCVSNQTNDDDGHVLRDKNAYSLHTTSGETDIRLFLSAGSFRNDPKSGFSTRQLITSRTDRAPPASS
jgi:hypothetical protein